jgi:hypothetical protein
VKENGIFFTFEYLIFIFIIKYSTSGVANIPDHGPQKIFNAGRKKKGREEKGGKKEKKEKERKRIERKREY